MSPNANRDKGLKAEREAADVLGAALGLDLHRLPAPGSQHEVGDIMGVPDTVVQVAYWPNRTTAAYVVKPDEAETQRLRAGVPHAITLVRHKGASNQPVVWRVAQTVEQYAAHRRRIAQAEAERDAANGQLSRLVRENELLRKELDVLRSHADQPAGHGLARPPKAGGSLSYTVDTCGGGDLQREARP